MRHEQRLCQATGIVIEPNGLGRELLGQQDDLPRVPGEMFDHVIDRGEYCRLASLDQA